MAGVTVSLSVRSAIRSGRGLSDVRSEPRQALPRSPFATDGHAELQVERLGRARETAFGDDAAALDERHTIAGRFYFTKQMGIEKHRHVVGAQFVDDAAHQQPAQWVKPGGRLIEKDESRIVQQRLRQTDALKHAFAVAAQRAIGGIEQVHAGQQAVDAGVER